MHEDLPETRERELGAGYEVGAEGHLTERVHYALELLDAAEEADVNLKLSDVAIMLGEEKRGVRDFVWEGLKTVVPFVSTRRAKARKSLEVVHEHAIEAYEEQRATEELRSWLAGLDEAQTASLVIEDVDYGDPYLSPLRLRTTKEDEPNIHELGYHFSADLDTDELANLPPAVRGRIQDRKYFWKCLGIETGSGLEKFIDNHFEKIELAFGEDEYIEEIDWLRTVEPVTFDNLQQLHADTGRKMYMWRLTKSPESVIQDVLNVAVNSQEKFISTWLEAFMKRERLPVILSSDIQAIHTAHDAMRDGLLRKAGKMSAFRRAVILDKLEAKLERDADFNNALENMQRLRSLALGIEIEGACNVEDALIMNRANDLMDLDLSGEKISDRLMIDTVLHTSEGIRQVLKLLTILIPTAEAMQHVPIKAISDSAKAVGSTDDLVGEGGEIVSLHAQGFKWGELAKRFGIIIPVAMGAVALGTQVENIHDHWGARVAAIAYTFTTFVTTAATLGLTTASFAKGYMRLAEQGKLIDQPYLNADQRAELYSAVDKSEDFAEAKERIDHLMSALIENSDISEKDLEKRITAIEAAARSGRAKRAVAYAKPTTFDALEAAYNEVFGVNPLRKGKLLSMPVMLGVAAILGGNLLSNPLIFVPFGAGEAVGGLGMAKYADLREGAQWKAKVRSYTQQAKPNSVDI